MRCVGQGVHHEGILAEEADIHPSAEIAPGAEICAIGGGPARRVRIGAFTRIGPGFKARVPQLDIGEWCTIHGPVKIYGYAACVIGDSSWIAQDVILNSTARLEIGRGAILSARASVWTHFSGGDPVQGCRFEKDGIRPCTLGEDVWIGVGAVIAPVKADDKSMALANAAIVKDMLANRVYGGVPAVDLTEKFGAPYIEIPVEQKLARLKNLFAEFALTDAAKGLDLDKIRLSVEPAGNEDGVSVFNPAERTYSALRTPEETAFMRFLLPHVKFYRGG